MESEKAIRHQTIARLKKQLQDNSVPNWHFAADFKKGSSIMSERSELENVKKRQVKSDFPPEFQQIFSEHCSIN
jgi:hypothetical protein